MNPREIAHKLKPYVENLLIKKAIAQTIREEVNVIQGRILATNSFYSSEEWGEPYRIADPGEAWLMPESDHVIYWELVADAYEKTGYQLKDRDYCPALIAENKQNEAERALIEAAAPYFNVTNPQLIGNRRERYLDLLIGLVVSLKDPQCFSEGDKPCKRSR